MIQTSISTWKHSLCKNLLYQGVTFKTWMMPDRGVPTGRSQHWVLRAAVPPPLQNHSRKLEKNRLCWLWMIPKRRRGWLLSKLNTVTLPKCQLTSTVPSGCLYPSFDDASSSVTFLCHGNATAATLAWFLKERSRRFGSKCRLAQKNKASHVWLS